MREQKTLYAITIEDVIKISDQENISFTEKDLPFIEERIGDYIGGKWQDAVEYALTELKRNKKNR